MFRLACVTLGVLGLFACAATSQPSAKVTTSAKEAVSFVITVEDADGRPVSDASVHVFGLRSLPDVCQAGEHGEWQQRFDVTVETGSAGTVSIEYPTWIHAIRPVGTITMCVSSILFVPRHVEEFPVTFEGRNVIVLQRNPVARQ